MLAQLARFCVRGLDPMLETLLMHKLERSRAQAGLDEGVAGLRAAVADLAELVTLVVVQAARGAAQGAAVFLGTHGEALLGVRGGVLHDCARNNLGL